MDTISTVSSATAASSATSAAKAYSSLGQDEFLELLVTELEHQDPLEPMSNTEFISQMAQFTSLEQTSEMNTRMGALYTNQSLNAASALIGKTVVGTDMEGNSVQGVVSYASINNGEVYVGSGDTKVALKDISYVVDAQAQTES